VPCEINPNWWQGTRALISEDPRRMCRAISLRHAKFFLKNNCDENHRSATYATVGVAAPLRSRQNGRIQRTEFPLVAVGREQYPGLRRIRN